MTKPVAAHRPLPHALFPDLAGHAVPDPGAAWITAESARLRAGEFGAALASLPGPAQRAALDAGFAAAHALAARSDIRVPEPEEFWAAGVRPVPPFDAEPGDAHLPIPAPHGLGPGAWLAAFADGALADDLALSLSSEVRRWFAALDAPATAPQLVRSAAHGPVRWTLRWLPVGSAAPELGPAYRADVAARYPSLPELLVAQIARARGGHPPLDPRSFTWIGGSLPDARFAARHGTDTATHTIRIDTRERTAQGPHLGTRLAA
ncbi:hypothetical protein [Leucobacter chromiireducens]|uniref:Uncharacterized protein n=1 Tax=Leucobacter chromiireducens subsp. solipictus TaxID=398235 RepID=A0ABS1SF21_9MICO|nr:hypothetical protein [Leucobacter chromiireducens]MBL3679153.1 hypothetical protein [Leucobacter chromiireducens subsp. solipictus]